jgi:hypothetical protein
MKRIGIVIVLFCIATLAISQTPNDKGTAKQDGAINADKSAESNEKKQRPTNSPPNETIVENQYIAPEHKGTAEYSSEDVEIQRQLAKFTKYLVWVGAFQVVALLVQAIFFYLHSRHLGALAIAASNNAVAASLNARAIINAERPWIRVAVLPDDEPGSFVFRATVRGRTPARIIAGDATHRFIDKPDDLPIPPTYKSPILAPPQVLLVDEEWFDIYPAGVNPASIVEQAKMAGNTVANKFLCFYGRVVYEDVFPVADEKRIPHETRWCFVCFVTEIPAQTGWRFGYSRDPDNPFTPSGPWEYREHT